MKQVELAWNGIDYDVQIAGPKERTEIFFQGCDKTCEGCFNEEIKEKSMGRVFNLEDILTIIREKTPQKRITFGGGEPFLQEDALHYLTKTLKEEGFHIVVYTGYYMEEIKDSPVLNYIDMLIDGPFNINQKLEIYPPDNYVGSSNQRVFEFRKE